MATVEGSPFGAGEHPVLGGVVQFHDTGVVATTKAPRNPRTPKQQQQRLRVAVMNEALRGMGSRWWVFWIEFVSNPSRPRWHQVWVQVGSRAAGSVEDRHVELLAGLSGAGVAAWDAAAVGAGLRGVSVVEGEMVSAGFVLLRLIASIQETSVGFEDQLEAPGNGNAEDWGAVFVASFVGEVGNAAEYFSEVLPGVISVGELVWVSVAMLNVGTATWTAAGLYRLGAVVDVWVWGIADRVELVDDVAPGELVRFGFQLEAPAVAGFYSFEWRMVQDGVGFFGESSPAVELHVTG